MTGCHRGPAAVALALVIITGARVSYGQPRSDVTVRTAVDRTALFVGDRAIYTIELTCKRGVEVLVDDLSRDKLKLEGLEAVGETTDRQPGPDGTTIHTVRFVVTTYGIDAPALRIAPLTIRYAVRRAGQRLEDATPAGEVQVPGTTFGFRSVLPEEPDLAGLRSNKPPDARGALFAALQPIGIGLIIVSLVPALAAIAAVARRARRPIIRRSARAMRQEERASLDVLATLGVDSIEGRREAFTKMDVLVREHLSAACGVAAASLTPDEVPFALATSRTSVPAELVASVLTTCELARYAPPHHMPSAEVCRQTVEQVRQIVA